MRNLKKNTAPPPTPDLLAIPAYQCFCALGVGGKKYQWRSWGGVIRELREYVEMDQMEFGRLLQGYTRGQVARYETEQTEPPLDFWLKLVRMFGLGLHWTLTGKGLPYITDFHNCQERRRLQEWTSLIERTRVFLQDLESARKKR